MVNLSSFQILHTHWRNGRKKKQIYDITNNNPEKKLKILVIHLMKYIPYSMLGCCGLSYISSLHNCLYIDQFIFQPFQRYIFWRSCSVFYYIHFLHVTFKDVWVQLLHTTKLKVTCLSYNLTLYSFNNHMLIYIILQIQETVPSEWKWECHVNKQFAQTSMVLQVQLNHFNIMNYDNSHAHCRLTLFSRHS